MGDSETEPKHTNTKGVCAHAQKQTQLLQVNIQSRIPSQDWDTMHYALLNTERKSKSCTVNTDAKIMSEAVSLQTNTQAVK